MSVMPSQGLQWRRVFCSPLSRLLGTSGDHVSSISCPTTMEHGHALRCGVGTLPFFFSRRSRSTAQNETHGCLTPPKLLLICLLAVGIGVYETFYP